MGEVGAGSRKDVRDAVAAARGAGKWTQMSTHARAQVLYYLAENLSARAEEFAAVTSEIQTKFTQLGNEVSAKAVPARKAA